MNESFLKQNYLRLGDQVPDFTHDSTHGKIHFYSYLNNSWLLFFSHPADFTPVCTTELSAFVKELPEWNKRNVKLLGLSINSLKDHSEWVKDIQSLHYSSCLSQIDTFPFPIIADENGDIASLFGMLDGPLLTTTSNQNSNSDSKIRKIPLTVRSVFLIDPLKRVRAIWTYPASTGRNTAELLRVTDSIQLSDKMKIATPVNWNAPEDLIIRVDVTDKEASELFPNYKTILPYLRTTTYPKDQ